MSAVNKITKYNLDERARELNENGTSLRDIADILSNESGHKINKDSVYTFLKSEEKNTAEIIEKKTALKVAVAEAEISTISDRQKVIKGLLELAENAEYDRDRVAAYKVATDALDSLDNRLGKLSKNPISQEGQTIININQNNLTIKDKIQRYRDAGIFNAQ